MFKSMASILSPAVAPLEKDQSPSSAAKSDDPEQSDPSVNTDALPEDHPIHLLAEAQTLYSNGRQPPFVLNKRSQVIKIVVIPTKNGSRPRDEKAVKAKIVAKVCTRCGAFFLSIPSLGSRWLFDPTALPSILLRLEFGS